MLHGRCYIVTVLTIRDVARTAGVSRQTVSRVLNDKPEIAPETRQRVLEVIERLGYRPNANARSLTGKRTQAIALALPDITNPFFTELPRLSVQRWRDAGA